MTADIDALRLRLNGVKMPQQDHTDLRAALDELEQLREQYYMLVEAMAVAGVAETPHPELVELLSPQPPHVARAVEFAVCLLAQTFRPVLGTEKAPNFYGLHLNGGDHPTVEVRMILHPENPDALRQHHEDHALGRKVREACADAVEAELASWATFSLMSFEDVGRCASRVLGGFGIYGLGEAVLRDALEAAAREALAKRGDE